MGTPRDDFSSLWGFDSDQGRSGPSRPASDTNHASSSTTPGPSSSSWAVNANSSGLSAAAGPFFSKRARQIQEESGVGPSSRLRDSVSATPSTNHLSDLFQSKAAISSAEPADSTSQTRGRARAGTLPSSWERTAATPNSSSTHVLSGSRFADKLGSDLRGPKPRSGASSPLGSHALQAHELPIGSQSRLRSASNASQQQSHLLPDLARHAFQAGPSSLASTSNASEGSPSESSAISRMRSDSLASNIQSDLFGHSNIFSPWAGSSPEFKTGNKTLPSLSAADQLSRGRGATIAHPTRNGSIPGSASLEGMDQAGLRTLDYLGLDDSSSTEVEGPGDAAAAGALESLLGGGRDRASTLAVPSADWRPSSAATMGSRNRSSTFGPSALGFVGQQAQRDSYSAGDGADSRSSDEHHNQSQGQPGSSSRSPETAAAVAAAVAAGRARAISMGRLDAPEQPRPLAFYSSGAATPPAYPSLHNEYVAREDLYAYAREHGLDPATFAAAAATHAGFKVLPEGSDRLPTSRVRAGTVAALGGIGGRARTEQELIRMAARGAGGSKLLAGGSSNASTHDFFDGRLPTPPVPHSSLTPGLQAPNNSNNRAEADATSPALSARATSSTVAGATAQAADRGQQPTRSLWVGNLNPSTTGQELMQAFAPYGAIESLRLLPDKECGFVNFVEVSDAIHARDDITNRLGGRVNGLGVEPSGPIKIGYGKIDEPSPNLKPRPHSPLPPGISVSGDRDEGAPTRALWVGSIPSATTQASLLSIFQPFGPVESARILTHKNCGFVNFERVDDAVRARKLLNGHDILGPEVGAVRVGFAKVPNKLEDESYPGDPMSDGYAIAVNQLSSLKGSNSVPVEQQMRPGNLETYRSHFVSDLLHGQQLQQTGDMEHAAPPSGAVGPAPQGLTAALAHSYHRSAPHSGLSASNSIVPSSDKGGVPLPSELQPRATVTDLQLLMVRLSAGEPQAVVDAHLSAVSQFRPPATYYTSIPIVSESNASRRFDTAKLRDMRKYIEQGQCHQGDIDNLAISSLDSIVDLASDYIGNTLVQKYFERCSEPVKTRMLELIAPNLATIGIHKNGTWAAQKILETAQLPEQRSLIAHHLRPFIPPLLLDQFGNYVVQGLLPYGSEPEAGDESRSGSDFVFDAMFDRCWEVAQGRFGARSMKATLEKPMTTHLQQKRVAMAVVLNSVPLATSPNGTLLLQWLLDVSKLPNRYRLLSPRFTPHLAHLCTHKLASQTVLRIVNQRLEPEAAHSLLDALFNSANDGILEEVLSEKVHGSQFVTHVLSAQELEPDRRERYAEQTRRIVLQHHYTSVPAYRKLVEDLGLQFTPNHGGGSARRFIDGGDTHVNGPRSPGGGHHDDGLRAWQSGGGGGNLVRPNAAPARSYDRLPSQAQLQSHQHQQQVPRLPRGPSLPLPPNQHYHHHQQQPQALTPSPYQHPSPNRVHLPPHPQQQRDYFHPHQQAQQQQPHHQQQQGHHYQPYGAAGY